MLPIEHKALHLYRINAYREYCWSVDAYGAYQPASFIYLCFESFGDLCKQYGVILIESDRPQHVSYGLIRRVEDQEDVQEIQSALVQGKNVIALLPNEIIRLHYGNNKARVDKAIQAAKLLGIEQIKEESTSNISNRETISWNEIPTNNMGRLFVTRDDWLSDGYFMDGYGKSNENTETLTNLVRELSTFKYRLLMVSLKNQVTVWPCHEPISFVIEIVNYGPQIENASVTIELDDRFEPISPLEREIFNLKTLSKTSFAFQVVPRIDGKFDRPFRTFVSTGDRNQVATYMPNWSIEITPSYSSALRSHAKQDDATLSKLLTIFKDTALFSEVRVLPDLIKVDVRACLNRMRSIAENLVYLVLDKKGFTLPPHNFATAIQTAQTNRIITSRSTGYFHTVRVIGNLASHSSSEPLTDIDVKIVAYSLACIMEDLVDKHLM